MLKGFLVFDFFGSDDDVKRPALDRPNKILLDIERELVDPKINEHSAASSKQLATEYWRNFQALLTRSVAPPKCSAR